MAAHTRCPLPMCIRVLLDNGCPARVRIFFGRRLPLAQGSRRCLLLVQCSRPPPAAQGSRPLFAPHEAFVRRQLRSWTFRKRRRPRGHQTTAGFRSSLDPFEHIVYVLITLFDRFIQVFLTFMRVTTWTWICRVFAVWDTCFRYFVFS